MKLRMAFLGAMMAAAGCANISVSPPATDPARPAAATAPGSPLGSPFGDAPRREDIVGTPLLIDRTDMRIGTTVQFRHIPTASELHDLTLLPGLSRVVMSFDSWPREYAPLQSINQAPQGVEVMAVLNGWPPSRAAIDAWNYLQVPLRIIVVVPGPPPSVDVIGWMNEMRGLERVIVQMDDPSRLGFERLQRPISFRKLVD